jgi:tRNA (mo5U34)-methyltransferase
VAKNQTDRIKRLHVGPVDLVGAPTGLTRRLFDNPLTKKVQSQFEQRRGTVPSAKRITKQDLDRVAMTSPEAKEIVDRIDGLSWYHTLDLGHGVLTPGFVDHRDQLPYYGLPSSLAGKRCLDIATFDGYWAFEFERRGADEVVALDLSDKRELDFPRWLARDPEGFEVAGPLGTSFKVAHDILDSKVKRVEKSVYNLDPDVDGMFDVVFISDVLIHLRDPQLAIERAYSVCKGELVVADVYSPALEALGDTPVAQFLAPGETWWHPNVACLKRMMTVAGFEPIEEVSRFVLDSFGHRNHKVVLRGAAAPNPSWTVNERAARQRRKENSAALTS